MLNSSFAVNTEIDSRILFLNLENARNKDIACCVWIHLFALRYTRGLGETPEYSIMDKEFITVPY